MLNGPVIIHVELIGIFPGKVLSDTVGHTGASSCHLEDINHSLITCVVVGKSKVTHGSGHQPSCSKV